MELFIFARFHVAEGNEDAARQVLLDVIAPSREEEGCLDIHLYRSVRDRRLFYIHSRWRDEAAFDYHANLPHTVEFVERIEPLIDHPFDLARTERLG